MVPRDDFVFHVEYNSIEGYGLGILNDMGAIYLRKCCLKVVGKWPFRPVPYLGTEVIAIATLAKPGDFKSFAS